MQLKLQFHNRNIYPICGFFIESSDLLTWLDVIENFQLNLVNIEMYAIPSTTPNKLWGCLVMMPNDLLTFELGKHQSAHLVKGKLIVPEKVLVIPELTSFDLTNLFKNEMYVFHQEFNLFKIENPLDLSKYVDINESLILETKKPAEHIIFNPEIKSFSVAPTPKELIKKELESNVKRERLKNKPLSFVEKIRLKFYEKILISDNEKEGISFNKNAKAVEKIAKELNLAGPNANDQILEDYKNLKERNKKEVDKLLDLLKNNPEEALKYAIPLDEQGFDRGEVNNAFKLQNRGSDFSLFGNKSISFGSGVDLGDEYFRLRTQYIKTAQELRKKGLNEKAAFIYMKLLKDYNAAASCLKDGKFYEKAALVYLDYLKNEKLAAECYEDAKIYDKSIEIYEKLKEHEKVGDLYALLGKNKSSHEAYNTQIDKDISKKKYLKAAKISRDKMSNLSYAQSILLEGWKNKVDQFNCLQTYFKNIPEDNEAWEELNRFNNEEINQSNKSIFFKVVKNEYFTNAKYKDKIKELSYSIISDLLESGKISSSELLHFNKENKLLKTDTMRYDLKKNKK